MTPLKLTVYVLVVAGALLGVVIIDVSIKRAPTTSVSVSVATQAVVYTASQERFPNPERGFYHQRTLFGPGTDRHPLTASSLARFRRQGVSLLRAYYVIDGFRDAPLSQQMLDGVALDLSMVRQAGIKMIPRFAYNLPAGADVQNALDAPLARVEQHIDQLAPVLRTNADVIAFVEAGFVGAWGEWHDSSNALVNADHSLNASSSAIVERLLAALPATRMVALRYPYHKRQLYGDAPLTSADAFTGIARARVGAHNDCFLANRDDGATYAPPPTFAPDVETLKEYLHQENQFVPQGGETCADSAEAEPYIHCSHALIDLARMRWSTINVDFDSQVIGVWRREGCLDDIDRRLGYRFRLMSAELPTQVPAGREVTLRFSIANDGFTAPYNPRRVELVLRHSQTGATHRIPLNIDPRRWPGGETQAVSVASTLPATVTPGVYQMFLNAPDPEPSLRNRPEYSIRLANRGTWESSTGFNSLEASLTVTAVPASPDSTLR